MLKLYGCGSPNVVKIFLMLSELGLDYEFEDVDLFTGLDDPEFLALNPNRKLPVLVDDGRPIIESGAILIHLAEKSGRFLPAGGPERSEVLQWLMWQMASVGPMFGQALHFRYIAPEGNEYSKGRYHREVERLYDVAETRLSQNDWLGGSEYSIADIAAFPWLGRYAPTLHVDLANRPAVRAWAQKIEESPAHQAIANMVKTLFKAGLARQGDVTQEQMDRFFGRAPA